MEEDLLERSYHEAAHAVFHYYAGFPIRYLSLETPGRPELDDGCAGGTPSNPTPRDLQLEAAICLAGPLTEGYVSTGQLQHPSFEFFVQCAEAGEADCMKALRAIRLAAGPWDEAPQRKLYADLCRAVARFTEERWSEISSVAYELAQSRYLTGDECIELIESTPDLP